LTLYLLSALIKVLYYPKIIYFNYLYLINYLYRFLELINSFIITILIEGDNSILKYYKLNLYYLFNLGGILYYPEMTYPVLSFIYFINSYEFYWFIFVNRRIIIKRSRYFIATTLIKGDNNILKHYKLNLY
jgi:hypothetical protein